MNTNQCWVLLRRDLTYHQINVAAPDRSQGVDRLYDQPTVCGQQTPTEHLAILQYTQAMPDPVGGILVCQGCGPQHAPRLVALPALSGS